MKNCIDNWQSLSKNLSNPSEGLTELITKEQKMNNKPLNQTCKMCDFEPFCATTPHTMKRYHSLKKNDVLCLSNNKFRSLYAVQEGALKSYHVDASGNELIRGFYLQGEIFGYDAIYANYYHYNAAALSDTLICEIPFEHILETLQEKPSLQKHILGLLSEQLSATAYLTLSSAHQRMAAFLLDIDSRILTREKDGIFQLPMSRQHIGNFLNLATETVSRILTQFQEEAVIKVDNKKINLLNIAKLKQMVEGY